MQLIDDRPPTTRATHDGAEETSKWTSKWTCRACLEAQCVGAALVLEFGSKVGERQTEGHRAKTCAQGCNDGSVVRTRTCSLKIRFPLRNFPHLRIVLLGCSNVAHIIGLHYAYIYTCVCVCVCI